MPIAHGLDQANKVFRTTMSGTVTMDDLHEHLTKLHATGAHTRPGIVDARDVSDVSFNTRELLKLADRGRDLFAHANPPPNAVVVKHTMYFGMARLFAVLVAGWIQVSVFDEMPAAEAWLDQFISQADNTPEP